MKPSRNITKKTIINNIKGAVAVEFAFVLPVLVLLIFGIIEFGLLIFNQQVITSSSREGARAGLVTRINRFNLCDPGGNPLVDPVNVENVVNTWIDNNLVTFGPANVAQIDVEIQDENDSNNYYSFDDSRFCGSGGSGDPCNTFQCPLRVTVSYNYEFLVLSIFGFGPVALDAQTVMNME